MAPSWYALTNTFIYNKPLLHSHLVLSSLQLKQIVLCLYHGTPLFLGTTVLPYGKLPFHSHLIYKYQPQDQ